MRVRFAVEADADIESIEAYIRRDNPDRARTFARDLALAAIAIRDAPFAYAAVGAGLRRKVYKGYLIIYLAQEREVEIVRVLHGTRDIERLLRSGEP